MSEAQKIHLEQKAYSMRPRDYERKVRKLITTTDCPFSAVIASSGGPSTENVFACTFHANTPALFGWSPDCATMGKKSGCALLKRLVQRKEFSVAIDLRKIQTNSDLFEIHIESGTGSWKAKSLTA